MNSIQFAPFEDRNDSLESSLWSPGLHQWLVLLSTMKADKHGLAVMDVAKVEACCIFTMLDFESADFVVRTHDDRRFHLSGVIDGDTGTDAVVISVKQLETGQRLPFLSIRDDPTTYWSRETDIFSRYLPAASSRGTQ